MRKSFKRLTALLIFMILCLTIGSPAVMAAEKPGLELGVTVNLSGTLPPEPEVFLIKLTADEMGNPMPEATVNGVYTRAVTGEGTATFPKITFDGVGVYKYRVWQQPGVDPNGYYDTTIYHLNVFITNVAGGGLEITSVLSKEGETEKSPDVVFDNRYSNPATVRFEARKLMDGSAPADGQFTFLLTDAAGRTLQTKVNDGDQVLFDEILIQETGTQVYYLKEVTGPNILISYDPAMYKMTVTGSKDSTGDYVATTVIELEGSVFPGTPIFRNRSIPGELPNTGETQSTLPIIGGLLILGGIALSMNRRKAS